MSENEPKKSYSEAEDPPEKPFEEEEIISTDEEENASTIGTIIGDDISEIDKQLDKVVEMINIEEEAYAELEKKVEEIQDEPHIKEPTMAHKVDWNSSSTSDSSASSEEHEEGKLIAENWMAALLPSIKSVLQHSDDVSEEKMKTPDEFIIAETIDVARTEVMLEADNPMLAKFQTVLKQHLLRQITKLKEHILEIEGEHKKKEVTLKAEADLAYKEQQILIRQRENLESFRNTIEKVSKQRITIDDQIKYQKELCDQFKEKHDETKTEMRNYQGEAAMLDDLVRKMSEHDKKQEREINLSKQKQAFTLKDKERLSKEKQSQDMLLWRMTKNILEKRRELEDCVRKTKRKTKECNILSERLLAASVDRAELLLINDLLTKELQKSFQHIKARDTAYLKIKKELQEAETNWKKLAASLNWYRKHLRLLMAENETLTFQKTKTTDEIQFLHDKTQMLKEKHFRALEELNSFDEMMKGADRDFQSAEQLYEALRADEEHIFKQTTIANTEKMRLEKAYMEKLIYRDTTGKMVKHVNDLILKMIEEHKTKELKMYKLENQLAKEMVELEVLKGSLRENDLELEIMRKQINELENSKSKLENNLVKLTSKEFESKSSITEKKATLEEMEKSWSNKTYLAIPLVIKKNKVIENIARLEKIIKEKAEIWLEFQEGCLRASSKRQKQLERINLLRRQVVMLDGTLERSVKKQNELQQELHQVLGDIDNHRRKMSSLQAAEIKQDQKRQQAEVNAKELEESFVNLLKDLEKEAMNLQQEVWELEEENEKRVETIDLLQRELLEWNKKYSMAVDLKKEIEGEKKKGGEIAAMKQEIHRMEVRFSNLRKVEERLMSDLELCLSRRDSIINSAEAKEKRAKASGITIRAQAWRRLEDIKAKLRSLIREFKDLKTEKSRCLEQRKFLASEADFWKRSVDHLSMSLEQLEQQIKEGQIHRHRTLEMTIMRQRKTRLLEELKCGRYRVAGKTEDNLAIQDESAWQIQASLLNIINKLKQDFPILGLQLKQIENTISYKLDPEEIENK